MVSTGTDYDVVVVGSGIGGSVYEKYQSNHGVKKETR